MRSWLERRFELRARGTSVRTELVAGATTFLTLSYILFVQPSLLSSPACGMDAGGVLFATCVASALACFLMAFLANHPIALAPAMGTNFFFVFAVCAGMGYTWRQALAANFLAGLAFLALVPFGFREAVMEAVPEPLKHAIAAGIGLLIALVGLEWGGLVVDHPALYVQLGDLGSPVAGVTLAGLFLACVLYARRVPAAILLSILAMTVVVLVAEGLFPYPLARWHGVVAAPPSPASTALQLDFAGLLDSGWTDLAVVVATFFLLDLFDTIGTLIGVADRAGLLVDGRLPRARGALTADAAGTTVGALLGTSTVTSYVESAAGVASGGRTGLTALVCGMGFLAALFLQPLIRTVGSGVEVELAGTVTTCYPLIAPALILIGALMLRSVGRIDWHEPATAIPCFLTLVVMPFSVSITDGIAWGTIAWSVLSVATGSARRDGWLVHAMAAIFVLRYALLP